MSVVKLSEIAEFCMARNGQYILESFENLDWNWNSFWAMMKSEIDNYGGFVPLQKKFNILCPDSVTYDFTHDVNNVGYVDYDNPGTPPKFLTSVVPVNTTTLISSMSAYTPFSRFANVDPNRLIDPVTFIWEYRKPKLTMTEGGTMDVFANYNYKYTKIFDDNNKLIDVEIEDLDWNDCWFYFQGMLSGRFMMSLGKSRRAFTYTEMPIVLDADQLVKEGQEEYDKYEKQLGFNHSWFDAIRP